MDTLVLFYLFFDLLCLLRTYHLTVMSGTFSSAFLTDQNVH